jgi:hypothetical protein
MAISELIAQTIAQHIANPKIISYAGTKLNEVQGRFVASNRVYNFVLTPKGVSYSPAGQGDSLLFSALFLRQDAVRKPKIGNDKCNAGVSYQCGKICLGNRRKCHKGVRDVNDARRIASILASTNEKLKGSLEGSDKAIARGKAMFEARGNRVANPKVARAKPDDTDALNRLEQLGKLGEESKAKTETFESKLGRMLSNKLISQKDADQFNQDLKSLTPAQKKAYFDERAKVRAQQDKARRSEKAKKNKQNKKNQEIEREKEQQRLESFSEGKLSLRAKAEHDNHLKNIEFFYNNGMAKGAKLSLDEASKRSERFSDFAYKLKKLHDSAFNPSEAQKQQQLREYALPLDEVLSSGKAIPKGIRDNSSIPWKITYNKGDGEITSTIVGAKLKIGDKGENYIEITTGHDLANMDEDRIEKIKDGTYGDPFTRAGHRIFFKKDAESTLKAKRLIREMTEGVPRHLDKTYQGKNRKDVVPETYIESLLTNK